MKEYFNELEQFKEENAPQITEKQRKELSTFRGFFLYMSVGPFLLAGVVFVIVGLWQFFVSCSDEKQCTELVTGIVTYEDIDEKELYDSEGNVSGHSVSYSGDLLLKYVYNGEVHYDKGSYLKDKKHNADDKIDVYVDPDDPEHIYMPSENEKKEWIELAIAGAVVTVICAAIAISKKRQLKRDIAAF
jgi:hypothetical protein